ncbi:MAG: hypothetical protein VKN56_01795 [Cyanobacteriota bacterium]|nr:hypothetical protein [Cyanobacteriota bacterium]
MEPPSLPATTLLQVERAVAPIAFPDPALEQVLRSHLFPPGSKPGACHHQGGVRYAYNRFDLDGDRRPETLVALLGRQACGPGGCPVLLLKEFGRRSLPLQMIPGFHTTLVVSESRSQGWRDLILPDPKTPEGSPPKRLTHNGSGYPERISDSRVGFLSQPTKGVGALMLKASPFVVQGHRLICPVQEGR